MMLKCLARLLRLPAKWVKVLSLLCLSLFFCFIGFDHFLNPNFYLNIMPQEWPLKLEAVYISGLFEIIGGMSILYFKLRKIAGWGLITLLIAVYPANIHMAVNYHLFPDISIGMLYFRLVLQFVFLYWVFSVTLSKRNECDLVLNG